MRSRQNSAVTRSTASPEAKLADIKHVVIHNGKECGIIVYDSKDRGAWRNDYVDKLAKDQRAAKAEHAILSTRKFPANTTQLHVDDGVIIANPARWCSSCPVCVTMVTFLAGPQKAGKKDCRTLRFHHFKALYPTS